MQATDTKAARDIPCAPVRFPVLGHIPQLRHHPLGFVRSLRTHGDVVKFYLGRRQAYAVNHPELIRRMLVADAKSFNKGLMYDKSKSVSSNGLFSSEGAFHHRQRRLMQPAFHHTRIAHYVEAMRELAAATIDSWSPGREIALDHNLYSFAITSVAKTLFGTDVDEDLIDDFRWSVPAMVEGLGRRTIAPNDFLERLPTPANLRFTKALETLRVIVDRIIDDRLDASLDGGDLLSMLLLARDETTGAEMPRQQIHDEVVTILVAGTESTADALSWACYLLARHPDVQRRLHAEIDQILDGRPVGHTDLQRLSYTQQVITETLRLYPSSWILMRRSIDDVDLGGYHIPANAIVLFSVYALQRDSEFYERPDSFDPDRWLTERAKNIPRTAYMPFATGIRGCIGEQFARAEMAVFLATIAQRRSILPAPGKQAKLHARVVLAPSDIAVITTPR